jgi:hypothetical protein
LSPSGVDGVRVESVFGVWWAPALGLDQQPSLQEPVQEFAKLFGLVDRSPPTTF